MFVKRSLIALSIGIALTACGGSGGTTTPTPAPSPSSIPTPITPSAPTPLISEEGGVLVGQAVHVASASTAKAVAVLSPDKNAIVVLGSQGDMLEVTLTEDSSGNISQQGMIYLGQAPQGAVVQVTGSLNSDVYTLEINQGGIKLYDITVSMDDAMSNMEPAINGYYELDSAVFESAGLVVEDGIIDGNDTAYCSYAGKYIPVSSNVFEVNINVSSIAPYNCNLQGDYSGLASLLSSDASVTGGQELLLAVHNGQNGLVRPMAKASDEPKFAGFPAGLYYQNSSTEFKDISFAVSHDGIMRGVVVNKLFAGYFDAQPDYMGKGYVVYDDNVLYYDKSSWHTVKGYLALSDLEWDRGSVESSSEVTEQTLGDFVEIEMGVIEEPTYVGHTSMAIVKKTRDDFPVQFSSLVGNYVVEGGANINLTIATDGSISGIHHGCDITGQISERTDTPVQEFAISFTRVNCPAVNSFSLDGRYEGFGFASYFEEDGHYKLDLFMSGRYALGQMTNLMSLNSLSKQ
jgi:hypothetical protein